jgi:hypothetical protein
MNRTLYLLLAVIVLGALAWFVSSSGSTPTRLADGAEERQFAYEELEDIHKIFVADRKGHTVTLTRGGETGWLADGKPANENVMKNLLNTVRRIDIQSLPTQKAVPNMVKNLATQGILVQLFDRNDKKLRGYYIGGSTNDETGTYAIVENSENPYVVHQPGFTGNIRARFNLWDDEWRSKVYFRVDPDKVESFSIDYPRQQSKSFELKKERGKYVLRPLYETGQSVREIPRGVAEGILSRYEKYYVNRYENNDKQSMEEARQLLPFAVIAIKEEGKEVREMRVFPRYQGRTLMNDVKTGEFIEGGGLEAFTAFINNGQDWVLLNVETTQPLLVAYDSF